MTATPEQSRPTSTSKKEGVATLPATVRLLTAVGLIALLLAVVLLFWPAWFGQSTGRSGQAALPVPPAYDAQRAMGYLRRICDLGPRISGSEGMQQQQALLKDFFTQRGGQVELQTFEVRHPQSGQPVTLGNLIARWGAERPKRFLICAHYDTRPYPDRDPVNPRGVFIGANDGGSGTAALMELSHHLDTLPRDVGVDLVLFDGEELVYQDGRDDYFLGSTHFARQYAADPPSPGYQAGVLLDMVGDADLQIFYERNSWRHARGVAQQIWGTAARLGITAFQPRLRHEIRDDHLPLNQIANIPTVDVIDFDYPRPGLRVQSYWHTQQDVPANCSGHSIAAVVYVIHQWLLQR